MINLQNEYEVLLNELSGVIGQFQCDEVESRQDIINRGIIKFNVYKFVHDYPESSEIMSHRDGKYVKEPIGYSDQQYLFLLSQYIKRQYLIDVPLENVRERRQKISNEVCYFLEHYEEIIPYLIASNHKTYDRYRLK